MVNLFKVLRPATAGLAIRLGGRYNAACCGVLLSALSNPAFPPSLIVHRPARLRHSIFDIDEVTCRVSKGGQARPLRSSAAAPTGPAPRAIGYSPVPFFAKNLLISAFLGSWKRCWLLPARAMPVGAGEPVREMAKKSLNDRPARFPCAS
jgi:hypothetical protein